MMKSSTRVEHVQVQLRAPRPGAVLGRIDMTPRALESWEVVTDLDTSLPGGKIPTTILIEQVRIEPVMDLEFKIAGLDVLDKAIEEKCVGFVRIVLCPRIIAHTGCSFSLTAFAGTYGGDKRLERIRVEWWGLRLTRRARRFDNVLELRP